MANRAAVGAALAFVAAILFLTSLSTNYFVNEPGVGHEGLWCRTFRLLHFHLCGVFRLKCGAEGCFPVLADASTWRNEVLACRALALVASCGAVGGFLLLR